jgi:hypothetical protein
MARNLKELMMAYDKARKAQAAPPVSESVNLDSPFAALAKLQAFSSAAKADATVAKKIEAEAPVKVAPKAVLPTKVELPVAVKVTTATPTPAPLPVAVINDNGWDKECNGRTVHYIPMSAAFAEPSWEERVNAGRVAKGRNANSDYPDGKRIGGRAVSHVEPDFFDDEDLSDIRSTCIVAPESEHDEANSGFDEAAENAAEQDAEDEFNWRIREFDNPWEEDGLASFYAMYGGTVAWRTPDADAAKRNKAARRVDQQFSHGRTKPVNVVRRGSNPFKGRYSAPRHIVRACLLGRKPNSRKYGGVQTPQYGKTDTINAMQAEMDKR